MNLVEPLTEAMQSNTHLLKAYLADLTDSELIAQLPGQGQHALWILTHLLVIEDRVVNAWIRGAKPMLDERWGAVGMFGTVPQADASAYPDKECLLSMLDSVRTNTLKTMTTLPLDQWDKPSPPEAPPFLATAGLIFIHMPQHVAFHTGQFASIRRMLGRKPLMR